jgi:DNA-3-methyladenine glycosylase II
MSHDALHHLRRADKVMGRLIERVGPCTWKPRRNHSPFKTLVMAVAHQQLNATAANTILSRVKALYPGKPFPSPEELLATPDEPLRGAGLSRSKVASIKDIAANTIAGVVPTARAITRMDDAEILSRLTTIRGVGPWTVHMLLIFKLGRPDVLPTTDYGVRKGFAVAYRTKELPTPNELLEHGERWRPYRSFAAWYLWRALELD